MQERGEISFVDREVDPEYELAAVTKCFQKTSENALLFERVKGTGTRIATNLYGSHARLCDLIGAPRDGFCRHWNGSCGRVSLSLPPAPPCR